MSDIAECGCCGQDAECKWYENTVGSENAMFLDQNEKLAIENQRLFRESQQAWTSHKIASEERATLHKLVGEMAGFLIMFIDFHTIPSGDFHTKHGDQVTMDILNMAGELLAKAKLEIGEGR